MQNMFLRKGQMFIMHEDEKIDGVLCDLIWSDDRAREQRGEDCIIILQ